MIAFALPTCVLKYSFCGGRKYKKRSVLKIEWEGGMEKDKIKKKCISVFCIEKIIMSFYSACGCSQFDHRPCIILPISANA